MANLFGTKEKFKPTTHKGTLETKYNNSVANLLLVIIFSAVNIVLLVANSDTYFLFSAFIPYVLADLGMFYTGMYPVEYYYDVSDVEFFDKSFLIVTLAVAVIVILLYLLCWIFARKKKVGWLIFAAVLFCVDTAVMFVFGGFSTDSIFDIVFHAWVVFSLINGIVIYYKIKKLPEEESEILHSEEDAENQDEIVVNSNVLRMADMQEKARILLEAESLGYHIAYRRVKRTNELVVNGRVYDEYEALVELPHTLTAVVDGHRIEVQYDSVGYMYILLDGNRLAKKLRLF